MRLSGKTALITGAGRGIGREIALAYAREGCDVALVARSADQLGVVAAKVRALGRKALTLPGDVTAVGFAEEAVESSIEYLGALDILVNNAGVFLERPLAETSLEDFDRVLAVNLRAPFVWARAVLPHFRERLGGLVLNISSQAGRRAYPLQGAYCASKFGLRGLTRVLAWEMSEWGGRASCICPGGVDTELLAGVHQYADKSEYMRPEDVAEAAILLATLPSRAAIDEIVIRRYTAHPVP